MIVAAFDPGLTTGFAVAKVTTSTALPVFKLIHADEITTYGHFNALFVNDFHSVGYQAIIVESFNLFPDKAQAQTGSTFPSSQWIGVIRYTMHTLNAEELLVYQTPSEKARINNDMLRRFFGSIVPSPHIRDALRHIVFWSLEQRYGS